MTDDGTTQPGQIRGDRGTDNDGVCVVTHPLSASGENATRTLLDVISKITPVFLITADLPEGSGIRDQHEVHELSRRGLGSSPPLAAIKFVALQLRITKTIRRRPEPVVLFFGATTYLLPILAARLMGRTVVLEPRGDVPLTLRLSWERRLPTSIARMLACAVWLLERACFYLATDIVTYTPRMAEQLDLGRFALKLHPTGARYVDTDHFSPRAAISDRPMKVGFVGRLDEEKGIRFLAQVAAALPDDVTFVFVGDGELYQWLTEELRTEIDVGTVELTGWVDHDDLPSVLNRLRLLVLPSRPTEGLPTTILESMACGTPAFATPVSGVPDVIMDGETGFLMAGTDPADIADEIQDIVQRGDLPRIGENAREFVCSEYSFEAAVSRYREILDSIG